MDHNVDILHFHYCCLDFDSDLDFFDMMNQSVVLSIAHIHHCYQMNHYLVVDAIVEVLNYCYCDCNCLQNNLYFVFVDYSLMAELFDYIVSVAVVVEVVVIVDYCNYYMIVVAVVVDNQSLVFLDYDVVVDVY
jgi:hypothetical protein